SALARGRHSFERFLRIRISLFRRQSILHGLLIILGYAMAVRVRRSKVELGFCISFSSKSCACAITAKQTAINTALMRENRGILFSFSRHHWR
ncbi:MAG: hypothetical protein FWH25_02315, partial [Syntrophorhabdaceae bacterium]|nr:hypothetical protein [Syntrophorhabdaceae bacterium]